MQTPRRAPVVSIHDVGTDERKLVFRNDTRRCCRPAVDQVALWSSPIIHSKAPIQERSEFRDWLKSSAQMHGGCAAWILHSRPRSAAGWWDTLVTEHYTAREGEFYDLSEQ